MHSYGADFVLFAKAYVTAQHVASAFRAAVNARAVGKGYEYATGTAITYNLRLALYAARWLFALSAHNSTNRPWTQLAKPRMDCTQSTGETKRSE